MYFLRNQRSWYISNNIFTKQLSSLSSSLSLSSSSHVSIKKKNASQVFVICLQVAKFHGHSFLTNCTKKGFTFNNNRFFESYKKFENVLYRCYASKQYPTHTIISMPALSPTMTMGSLGTWQKNIGDEITPGDVLVEIETDKAQMDFECQEEGYLAKILVESGTKEVNVGKPIAVLAESKDSIEEFADFAVEEAARRLAVERNISLDQVTGTGPKNRITKSDVENYIASGGAAKQQQPTTKQPSSRQTKISTATPTVAAYKDIPLSNVRKVIATRLSESKQAIPHYYLTVEVEVDEVLKLRETLNSQSNGRYKLSVNDFIIKASASALMVVPEVNSAWYNDFIRQYQSADVSVATATPTGLLTPIVRNAQSLGLASISNQVKELAGRAREGKLTPEEYQGGSFTISNLGMYGIKSFTAIINPPQSCILAIGSAEKKLILDSSPSNTGGEYRVVNTLHATLSCDHRVVDGAVGAQWLKEWRSYIENPYKLLL